MKTKQEKEKRIRLWMELKIRLDSSKRRIYFREREVWWAHLGANIGCEEDGKNESFERPVIIIKILYGGQLLWVIPLTTANKNGDYYFRCDYHDADGKNICQNAMLSHLRSISSNRLIRKLRTVPRDEHQDILKELCRLIQ